MRVTVTGATGLIGQRAGLGAALARRAGDRALARSQREGCVGWPTAGTGAGREALAGRDAVVHLAGEEIAQRWNAQPSGRSEPAA